MDAEQNLPSEWGEIDEGIYGPRGRRNELQNKQLQAVLAALMMQGDLPEGTIGEMTTDDNGGQDYRFEGELTPDQINMILNELISRSQ